MNTPQKKNPRQVDPVDEKLSDEELNDVHAGNRNAGAAEQQINIGDLPNVRVDITPM